MQKKIGAGSRSILMVSSEAVPYAKSGGLADAVTALARELDRRGHDVRILLPRYYFIRKERLHRHPTLMSVRVGEDELSVGLYEAQLQASSVVVYFADLEELYGRDGVYGDRNGPFSDNLRRFALLSHAAFEVAETVGWTPDIVHAHDWPGGLVPTLAKQYRISCESAVPGTVFSIHNLGYQGIFPVANLPETGIGRAELNDSALLHDNSINLLHCGIASAEMITTVSPGYAREIQTPQYGFGLDRALLRRSDSMVGILNGVDYDSWSPDSDPFLVAPYTVETVALKARTKTLLQQEMGLPTREDVPLIGIVSRLASQKGFEELASPGYGALPAILTELDAQVVVLGSGEEAYKHALLGLAKRYSNLALHIGFDDRLAHVIEAGSDFFLMPSRYEPCGLNQLYSMAYGTIPIVTRTGGLADTVQEDAALPTGFLIDHPCPAEIVRTVTRAVTVWRDEPARIDAMRRAGMERRFSWEDSAAAYEEVYERAVTAARTGTTRR